MIKYYYKSLRSPEMRELKEPQRGCWVYAEAASDKEIAALAKKFKLDEGHLKDALDEDEMPRLEREGDQSYIFVRFVYKNSDGELSTAPLLFVFGQDVTITVSLVRMPSHDTFFSGKIDFATTQSA
jgi:magnesium transporter